MRFLMGDRFRFNPTPIALIVLGFTMLSTSSAAGSVSPPLRIAQSVHYQPPDRSLPGNREPGATRGSFVFQGSPLTALIPENNYGATTTSHPVLFFYIPEGTVGLTVEFWLGTEEEEIYSRRFLITQEDVLLAITLDEDEIGFPLAPDTDYWWSLVLVENDDRPDTAIGVTGWIERIEPDTTFSEELNQAEYADRPELYAQNGIWFDAIATLAALIAEDPDNPDLKEQWVQLLSSVGLEHLADKPFSDAYSPTSQDSISEQLGVSNEDNPIIPNGFYSQPDNPSSPPRQGGGSR